MTTQLFVGRLPREMRTAELESIFEKYGKLSRCDVKRGSNLYYAFVEYEDADCASDALKNCNGMPVEGENIVVEFAKGASRKRDDSNCFRCGNEGHWARDCPDARRGGRSPRRARSRSPTRSRPYDRPRRNRNDRGDRNDRSDRGDNRGDRRDRDNGHRHRHDSVSPSRRSNARHGSHRNPRGHRDRPAGRDRSPRRHRSRSRSADNKSSARYRNGESNSWNARSPDSAVGNSPRHAGGSASPGEE
ncbi:hypothetical protein BX070DRAFT_220758 [Coemansia spiralis]|nr:hypothetical protein BX070DRAFT_220758 [Coemansia spiralis]